MPRPRSQATAAATTAAPPAEATPGNTATTEPAPAQPPAEPRKFDRPTVVDTARLKGGDATVALFGIVGQQGEAAQALQAYIAENGGQVTCQPQPNAEYICRLPDNTDVADVSLVNGAAQTRADSTDEYRAQEIEAQHARRGIWANLPPPPVQLKHPMVRDTATIVVEGKTYRLDGIEGLGGQYARDLQGYIAAHDDSLMCQPQAKRGSLHLRDAGWHRRRQGGAGERRRQGVAEFARFLSSPAGRGIGQQARYLGQRDDRRGDLRARLHTFEGYRGAGR